MATASHLRLIKALGLASGLCAGAVGVCSLSAETEQSQKKMKYMQGCNYPDLSHHNNMLADYLTPSMYNRLSKKITSNGFTLDKAIQYGVDYHGNQDDREGKVIGVVAGDDDSYQVFKELFDKIILAQHKGYSTDKVQKSDFDPSKIKGGQFDEKYVKSCRVRVGRNLRSLPFSPLISREERRCVEQIICGVLETMQGENSGDYFPLKSLTSDDKQRLRNAHMLFHDPKGYILPPSGMARDWPDARGIWYSKKKNILVWINEEDHMRFICMENGGNMKKVFTTFCNTLQQVKQGLLGEGWEFSWTPHYGYLASCPSNIGTSMRVGVHIRLQFLAQDERFLPILDMLGLQMRGTNGEHTAVLDHVYDISNSTRIGKTEVELVQLLINGIDTLIAIEQRLEKGQSINELFCNLKAKTHASSGLDQTHSTTG